VETGGGNLSVGFSRSRFVSKPAWERVTGRQPRVVTLLAVDLMAIYRRGDVYAFHSARNQALQAAPNY
jgi:hypothetical protein